MLVSRHASKYWHQSFSSTNSLWTDEILRYPNVISIKFRVYIKLYEQRKKLKCKRFYLLIVLMNSVIAVWSIAKVSVNTEQRCIINFGWFCVDKTCQFDGKSGSDGCTLILVSQPAISWLSFPLIPTMYTSRHTHNIPMPPFHHVFLGHSSCLLPSHLPNRAPSNHCNPCAPDV